MKPIWCYASGCLDKDGRLTDKFRQTQEAFFLEECDFKGKNARLRKQDDFLCSIVPWAGQTGSDWHQKGSQLCFISLQHTHTQPYISSARTHNEHTTVSFFLFFSVDLWVSVGNRFRKTKDYFPDYKKSRCATSLGSHSTTCSLLTPKNAKTWACNCETHLTTQYITVNYTEANPALWS